MAGRSPGLILQFIPVTFLKANAEQTQEQEQEQETGAGADAEVRRGSPGEPMQQDQERQEQEVMNASEFNVHRLRAFMRVPGCRLRAFMRVVLKRPQRYHRLRAFMRVKVAEQEQEQRSGKADNTKFANAFITQNPHSGWSPAPMGVMVARALGRQFGRRQ